MVAHPIGQWFLVEMVGALTATALCSQKLICFGKIVGAHRPMRPMERLGNRLLYGPCGCARQVAVTNKQHLDCNPSCGLMPPPIGVQARPYLIDIAKQLHLLAIPIPPLPLLLQLPVNSRSDSLQLTNQTEIAGWRKGLLAIAPSLLRVRMHLH
jgi:hypothetical protein